EHVQPPLLARASRRVGIRSVSGMVSCGMPGGPHRWHVDAGRHHRSRLTPHPGSRTGTTPACAGHGREPHMTRRAGARARWWLVVAFAIGMAWVEAASVLYMRVIADRVEHYQPD